MADLTSRDRSVARRPGAPDSSVMRLPAKAEAPGALRDAPASLKPAPAPPVTAAPAAPRPRRRWGRPLLFLLLPLALIAGAYEYTVGGAVMSTENAYVRADIVAISTDISGIVKDVDVRENQVVHAGDVLFRLDDLPFRLALDRAQAQIAIVAASLASQKASYRDMQAQIQQSQVDVDYFAREKDRQQSLVATHATSVASYDQAQRAWLGAQRRVASQQQQLAGIVASLAGNPDIAVEAHPRSLEAMAQRDEAARQLSHAVIVAPMAGVVANVPTLQPGQYLAAGTAAFSVVATDHLWIDANPKETELTYVRPGQKATVSVDTYPDETWSGVVDSIGPASSASFSMLPAQNTSGNWVKVVQRIPMRIRIDTTPGQKPLRAGMSVVLDVDTGHARGLPSFLTSMLGMIGFGARHG
jgi:membrane fusion protein (multidrug efflux system)